MPLREHRRVRPAYPHAPRGSCAGCGKPGATIRTRKWDWHPICHDRYREKVDYRAAAAKREGNAQRCVTCKRAAGEWAYDPKTRKMVQIRIERDHVVSLALFGRHDWTAGRCQLCHRDKSTSDNRRAKALRDDRADRLARRAGGKPMSEPSSSTRRTAGGRRSGGTSWVGVSVGAVSALALTVAVALTALALIVARWRWRRRRAHREDAVYRLRYLLAKETRTDPNEVRVKARRWSHAVPVAGQAWYSEVFDDDDPNERERIEGKVAHKLGLRLSFEWTPAADTFRWEPERVDVDSPAEAGAGEQADQAEVSARVGKVRERVEGAVRAAVKGEVSFEWGTADAVGPVDFTVAYPSAYNDESGETRQNLADRVNAKAPGRWRAVWDTEQNTVRFERRPPMPKDVPIPVTRDDSAWRLPFGIDEHGNEIAWDMRQAPHALVAGSTGSGKTVTLRAIIQAAVARGFVVFCVDPKRVEMLGLREWPGVRAVATETEHMLALVAMVADEMDARYAAIEAGDVSEDDLPPVLLVIDELWEFIERANEWWKAHKRAGMTGTEHPVVAQWRSMARLGRKGRVHLVVGTQRPDAKVFGGEARSNYGFRVMLGAADEQSARMMFGRTDVGRDIPPDTKGRATVGLGQNTAVEVQGYNTPDPRDRLSAAEHQLMARLRELAAEHASEAVPHINPRTVAERAREMAEDPAGRDRKPTSRAGSATARKSPPPAKPKAAPDPWQPTDPDQLDEGDRIRLELDGVLTEVRVDAPPCEAPDDPEVIEIEWRAPDGRAGVEAFGPGATVARYTAERANP